LPSNHFGARKPLADLAPRGAYLDTVSPVAKAA
jgi:hypothetical protein